MPDSNEDMTWWINPSIDFVLIEPDILQIRGLLNSDIDVSLRGQNSRQMAEALVYFRRNRCGIYKDWEFFEIAKKHGILINKQSTLPFRELGCFLPFEVGGGLYSIRIGRKIYIYEATSHSEIVEGVLFIGRRCERKEDRLVIQRVLSSPADLSIWPAMVPEDTFQQMQTIIRGSAHDGVVFELLRSDSDDGVDCRVFEPIITLLGSNDYWRPIIDAAVKSKIVVASYEEDVHPNYLRGSYLGAAASVAYMLPVLDSSRSQLCHGAGQTLHEAIGKACMEAIERYLTQLPPKISCRATADWLRPAVTCGIERPSVQWLGSLIKDDVHEELAGKEIEWTVAEDRYGRKVIIPSAVCYYGKYASELEEKAFSWVNSNGCAAHVRKDKAIEAGVLECIERDAIMIWWYNRVSPPSCPHEVWPVTAIEFIKEPAVEGFEVKLLNLTLDSMPVAMFVARNRNNKWPYFLCGAACRQTWDDAANKAFSEFYMAFINWFGQEQVRVPHLSEIRDPYDHEVFYMNPDHRGILEFLFDGQEVEPNVGRMEFEDLPWNWIVYDAGASHPGVVRGVEVVKVIVNELVPITFGFGNERKDFERLRDIPVKLGIRTSKIELNDLYDDCWPHFFP